MSSDKEKKMTKKYMEILGKKMAYLDEGSGQSIVFLHGNPTSSYLWRNITPHVKDLGRIIVPDLIGMGDSEKLEGVDNPDYAYHGQYKYLSNLLDALGNSGQIHPFLSKSILPIIICITSFILIQYSYLQRKLSND